MCYVAPWWSRDEREKSSDGYMTKLGRISEGGKRFISSSHNTDLYFILPNGSNIAFKRILKRFGSLLLKFDTVKLSGGRYIYLHACEQKQIL